MSMIFLWVLVTLQLLHYNYYKAIVFFKVLNPQGEKGERTKHEKQVDQSRNRLRRRRHIRNWLRLQQKTTAPAQHA